jgi:DNA repair protein RadC
MSKPTNATKLRFVLRDEVAEYGPKTVLDTPERIYDFFRQVIRTDENFETNKEHLFVVAVDARLRLIGYNVVSVGTVNETTAHPREILRPVIVAAAHAFILIHNHPSGDPSPSRADEMVTRRIVEAAGLMQIHLLDHVVCGAPAPGRTGYYSFREAGLIP